MNSAAPILQRLDKLKQEHPDFWTDALNEVRRRIGAGETIRKPEAYAVPLFNEMVEARQGELRADAARTEATEAIADCQRCDERGLYWEDQEAPYRPRAFTCDHEDTLQVGTATE